MNSKQRVAAAIARREVDRVPLGFYCADHDTIARVIGRKTLVRNKIDTQIALWQGRRAEVAEACKTDTVEFYRKLDCVDIILPKECPVLPPADYEPVGAEMLSEEEVRTGDGRVHKLSRESNTIVCVHDPRAAGRSFTAEQFDDAPPAPRPDESCFEAVDHLIAAFGEERYVPCIVPTTALVLLGEQENGLMMYALQPEVVHAAARRRVADQDRWDHVRVRPGSAGVMFDHDMAGTTGPLISPAMFDEMVLPYFRARAGHVKRFGDQLILHNCGNNLPLMGRFADAGVDCYQSLQTTAGMDVGLLKARYGDRMAFWGGMPLATLIAGTPDDVRRDVRAALARGAPGGGFIFGPSHSVAFNTRYDNFMAMLDEFVKRRDKVG